LFFALATTAIFKRCNTQAYQNFFKSTQGNRKGKPIRPPKFKKRMSLPTQDLQRVDLNLAN
jgi:transposase